MKASKSHTRWGTALIIMVLSLLSIFPPLSTDMYLSAFGDIQKYLNAPDGALELSLSVFFFGLCIGQLLVGPVIDRFGRKGPLLAGTLLFCLATIILLVTHSTSVFITVRIIQAIGASGGMVVGRTVISDLYKGAKAAQMMTVLVMLMTIGPVIAPLLGGLLITDLGWKSVFWVMLIVGTVAFVLTLVLLPESLPASERSKASVGQIAGHYWSLVKHRAFIVPAMIASLVMSSMFSFITASPSIFQGIFKLTNIEYGMAFGVVALGMVVASLFNNWLLKRIEVRDVVRVAMPLFVVVAVILFLVSGTHRLWLLMVPLWFSIAIVGLLSANTTSITMENAKNMFGVGSALIGFLQFGLAFICSSAIASSIGSTARPMALGIMIPSILALLLWLFAMPAGSKKKSGQK